MWPQKLHIDNRFPLRPPASIFENNNGDELTMDSVAVMSFKNKHIHNSSSNWRSKSRLFNNGYSCKNVKIKIAISCLSRCKCMEMSRCWTPITDWRRPSDVHESDVSLMSGIWRWADVWNSMPTLLTLCNISWRQIAGNRRHLYTVKLHCFKEKRLLCCKCLHKTKINVFTIMSAIRRAKCHLSSTIIDRVRLYAYVNYSAAAISVCQRQNISHGSIS